MTALRDLTGEAEMIDRAKDVARLAREWGARPAFRRMTADQEAQALWALDVLAQHVEACEGAVLAMAAERRARQEEALSFGEPHRSARAPTS